MGSLLFKTDHEIISGDRARRRFCVIVCSLFCAGVAGKQQQEQQLLGQDQGFQEGTWVDTLSAHTHLEVPIPDEELSKGAALKTTTTTTM